MRFSLKLGLIFLFLVFIVQFGQGYETEMFTEVDFFQDEYIRDYFEPNIYDISKNPALYRISYRNNFSIYNIQGERQLNNYARYFDPRQKNNAGLDLRWIKQLTKNSTLASGVKYQRSDHFNVTRSLEKNYYAHYFSFTDTTTGNIEYQGPRLWILYNHELADKLLLGLEIDYGVERGLKDVYTECETILRSVDAKMGIGYHSPDEKTILGINTRYFNRQGKYEAVKEMEDALVKTWFGYNLYYPENPRRVNRKNDDREGYKIGVQLERKNILNTGCGARLSGSYGQTKNSIEVGRPSLPQQRGYWEREGFQFTGNIYYHKEKIKGLLYVKYKNYFDWAKPKEFKVVALENDEEISKIGGLFQIHPLPKLQLDLGFELSSFSRDYSEYAAAFNYNQDRNHNFLLTGGQYELNSISGLHLHAKYGSYEPDFHWPDTEQFDVIGGEAGYKRTFLFGTLDLSLNYYKHKPDNIDESIERFGVTIYYLK